MTCGDKKAPPVASVNRERINVPLCGKAQPQGRGKAQAALFNKQIAVRTRSHERKHHHVIGELVDKQPV